MPRPIESPRHIQKPIRPRPVKVAREADDPHDDPDPSRNSVSVDEPEHGPVNAPYHARNESPVAEAVAAINAHRDEDPANPGSAAGNTPPTGSNARPSNTTIPRSTIISLLPLKPRQRRLKLRRPTSSPPQPRRHRQTRPTSRHHVATPLRIPHTHMTRHTNPTLNTLPHQKISSRKKGETVDAVWRRAGLTCPGFALPRQGASWPALPRSRMDAGLSPSIYRVESSKRARKVPICREKRGKAGLERWC